LADARALQQQPTDVSPNGECSNSERCLQTGEPAPQGGQQQQQQESQPGQQGTSATLTDRGQPNDVKEDNRERQDQTAQDKLTENKTGDAAADGDNDDDDDLDEDVREAKASIKGHLDRIRETEKFIKSIQEEEERFERQRRESFLFNNLIISTKLNGLKNGAGHQQRLDLARLDLVDGTSGGGKTIDSNGPSYSAPVASTLAGCPYEPAAAELRPSAGLGLDGGMGVFHSYQQQHESPVHFGRSTSFEPTLSCFNSDLFKPISSLDTPCKPVHDVAYTPLAASTRHRDPLEPVRPLSMHAFAPPTRLWDRSRSPVAGDPLFQHSTAEPRTSLSLSLSSSAAATMRPGGQRPLSASIDSYGAPGSNPYFPSRHKRSSSQVRHCRGASSGGGDVATTLFSSSSPFTPGYHDDSTPMLSEYKSSFVAPSLRARHHSLAPTPSACRRARSPLPLRASPIRWPGGDRGDHHDDYDDAVSGGGAVHHATDDDDDDDDGMSAYRASSYVPKVVPEGGPSTRGARGRTLERSLDGGSSSSFERRGRSVSRTNDYLAREKSPAVMVTRRRSTQAAAAAGGSTCSLANLCCSDNGPELVPIRRRSLASTSEASARSETSAGPVAAGPSRLSELEQRIQANKRRREELLQGIRSAGDDWQRAPQSRDNATSGRRRPQTPVAEAESDDDQAEGGVGAGAAAESRQSGGFERPSRSATERQAETSELVRASSLARAETAQKEREKRPTSSTTGRFRASRLESMEARIRRKSYCMRVISPERGATHKQDRKTAGDR
jgi:hypothetical protein